MTRDEAMNLGLTKYSTNVPCARGHISERYVTTGSCIACLRRGQQKYRTNKIISESGLMKIELLIDKRDEQIMKDTAAALIQAHQIEDGTTPTLAPKLPEPAAPSVTMLELTLAQVQR